MQEQHVGYLWKKTCDATRSETRNEQFSVSCPSSLLREFLVPQITKSLESFDILPQQYGTREVSKTLIMQLSFFGGVCKTA